MQITMDPAGRIVVPKAVREHFGLRGDSRLELEETADAIVLRPVERGAGLAKDEDGWLVFAGDPEVRINWDTIVDDMREERIREIGGLDQRSSLRRHPHSCRSQSGMRANLHLQRPALPPDCARPPRPHHGSLNHTPIPPSLVQLKPDFARSALGACLRKRPA
jgi:AbrB family looped-hinge helix DNA binding protein